MANDTVRLAAEQAAERFGGDDGVFNAANFSAAFLRIANIINTSLDGHVVRVMLSGRDDIEVLPGAHYRIVRN